jgi:hypothetical protein
VSLRCAGPAFTISLFAIPPVLKPKAALGRDARHVRRRREPAANGRAGGSSEDGPAARGVRKEGEPTVCPFVYLLLYTEANRRRVLSFRLSCMCPFIPPKSSSAAFRRCRLRLTHLRYRLNFLCLRNAISTSSTVTFRQAAEPGLLNLGMSFLYIVHILYIVLYVVPPPHLGVSFPSAASVPSVSQTDYNTVLRWALSPLRLTD